MEREFKFEIGDVVRTKADRRPLICDERGHNYNEHLTVDFRFWDGDCCCYVLNVGDDDICLISDEDSLELEERPPMPPEEVQPECAKESYFLGSVYRINNRLVAAEGLDKAIELFRSHPSHQYDTIESITLQVPDLALIQSGKEE